MDAGQKITGLRTEAKQATPDKIEMFPLR